MDSLPIEKLAELAETLSAKGYRVIAPIEEEGVVRLKDWARGFALRLDAVPVNSLKDALFPRSEVVGRAALKGDDFELLEVKPEARRTAILCSRPCDAASLALLDALFNWDSGDPGFNARRAATTVVSLACARAEERCFCTSVGGGPDSTAGADAILRPAEQGRSLILETLTEKGRELAKASAGVWRDGGATADPAPDVLRRFDADVVTRRAAESFESPLWREQSLACLGCGACAYACPTCHCFDLQDESTPRESVRLRNWDACGFGLFTLHASGHNPRADQSARWRQRVLHKLSYLPKRLKLLGCTGCGRCRRVCPAGMDIVATAARLASAPEKAS